MAKGRRGHGEGSVYQRADGYWTAAVEAGRCPGGHPKRDGVTVCKGGERRRPRIVRRTKKAVVAELDELRRRGSAGVAGRDPTVDEWMTWWIDTVKAETLSPASADAYRRWHRDRISPHIGHIRLRKLATADIRYMLARLESAGIGPKSRNTAKTVLSGALKHAVGERVVVDNVAAHVTGARLGAKLDDALTAAELDACLAACHEDRLYAILFVAATLGQRRGELLALRWDDVDLDGGTMRIDMAKTRAGERTLPLVAGTLDVLKGHRRRRAAERVKAGPLWRDHGLVFCKVDGRPISGRELLRWWYGIQKKAKVERRRWHALRHSAVGRMLDRGVPIEIVSAVAGHSGLSITADIYGRAKADRLRKALTQYDES